MTAQIVEMYIDPLCPWAWLTSRWLLEAERVRPFTLVTKVFSLAEVNREHKQHLEHLDAMSRPLRVLVAARRAGGEAAIRAVYTEMGEAHHERDQPLGDDATLRAAVVAAGLDAALVTSALSDEDVQAEVLAEHAAVVERGAFGVPTLSVDGSPAYFGPIVDRRITGAEAGRLWDIALPLLLHANVFELKRTRTSAPDIGRNRIRQEAGAASV
ncbi:MAG: DsbA family protein [Candidatus Dormibacteria bacterium]|jgi:predicted DsbA family dithiol-disulfide isomerase